MTESARFEELRFTGGRFDTSGLPFEVLPEHYHYRDLLLEVAKAMYFADNPYRRRLPNRFEESLHLRLSDIEHGSVRSIIERDVPDPDSTWASSVDDYFERARDHIVGTIQSSSNGAESNETLMLRDYDYRGFLQLGSTLTDDESIEYSAESKTGKRHATLDLRARQLLKTFVASSTNPNARTTRLVGRVTAVDAVNERFTLWLHDERRVCSGPYDGTIHLEFLRKHLTPDRETGPTVAIIGKIDFDSRHNPTGWRWMYSIASLDEDEGYERLARQLQEVERAPGEYLKVSQLALHVARMLHEVLETAGVPAPTAFPTPEGGVDFEWSFNGVEASLEIDPLGDEITLSHWDEEFDQDSYHEHVPARQPEFVAGWARESLRLSAS